MTGTIGSKSAVTMLEVVLVAAVAGQKLAYRCMTCDRTINGFAVFQ